MELIISWAFPANLSFHFLGNRGDTLGDTVRPWSIEISRWRMEGSRRGLRPWHANSIKNSYHQLGPSEVRNLPRVIQQQVSGRFWVRIQVSQSCPYYMLGTVLSGSHRVSAERHCQDPHDTDESLYPGATFWANIDGGGNEKSWQSLESAAPNLTAEKVNPHLLRDTPFQPVTRVLCLTHVLSRFSCVQLLATLWTVTCQAPLSPLPIKSRLLKWPHCLDSICDETCQRLLDAAQNYYYWCIMSAWEEEIERSWAYQEMLTLREKSRESQYYMSSLICGIFQKNDTNEFIYKIKTDSQTKGKDRGGIN